MGPGPAPAGGHADMRTRAYADMRFKAIVSSGNDRNMGRGEACPAAAARSRYGQRTSCIHAEQVARNVSARRPTLVQTMSQPAKTSALHEAPFCPVSFEELVDGLFGALTWFDSAYRIVCERVEMEMFNPHEYVLLRMICRYAENMRSAGPTELAEALGMSKGYVSKLSRSLIEEGMIARLPHRADGRLFVYDLTPEGEDIGSAFGVGEAFWNHMVAELGNQRARELAIALRSLIRTPQYHHLPW